MGDGQHVWAAAEWVMMVRNCFVREEGGGLVLCSGIPPRWLEAAAEKKEPIEFGPAPTTFGPVTIRIEPEPLRVTWEGVWRGAEPSVTPRL